MTEEREHPVEDLAAYVLQSLEGSERARVEAHVATCASCAGRLEEYRAVIGVLPFGLAPVEPPPAALATIRATARERRPRTGRWPGTVFLPPWLRVARWPALAALVALLLVWNVWLQQELARRAPGPAPGPEVEALARRPGKIIILGGTGKAGASARLFVAADGGHGHLALAGLGPLPRGRTYQLWFIRDDGPSVSGATFAVSSRERAWVKVAVPASLEDVRAIAITEEPLPGSVAPTGRHLLDAQPWR